MPLTAVNPDAKTKTNSLSRSLTQGKTKICRVPVDSGVKLLDVNLKWENKDNKLSLTAVSPSGKVLETKYDNSDGNKDGEITTRIKTNEGEYIEKGNWKFKVCGNSIKGSETFTLKSSAHK